MLNIFWPSFELIAVFLAMPHARVLTFVIDPFLPRSVDTSRILTLLICAMIGLQIMYQVNATISMLGQKFIVITWTYSHPRTLLKVFLGTQSLAERTDEVSTYQVYLWRIWPLKLLSPRADDCRYSSLM